MANLLMFQCQEDFRVVSYERSFQNTTIQRVQTFASDQSGRGVSIEKLT